ncbi:MAG: NAD-dependent epimerase/dehydratase family protein [Puia sp.]|nr:NAD-dependent epimerase/dehydratase family protein [Puia sp.]
MSIHTILGAGGVIGTGLARELITNGEKVRLVSRTSHPMEGCEGIKADISDPRQTLDAVRGSSVVYLCAGLPYDYSVWRRQWSLIMDSVIAACSRSQAKLIFFDNVYMYGLVNGGMTEESPYNPCSKKGDLRARIATRLMSEVRKGNITASIARSADFYGPGAARTSVPGMLVFENLAKGKKAQWLINAGVRHSFTYIPDAVRALHMLAKDENSWNQAWHLPTAPDPLTGKEFIGMAAAAMGVTSAFSVLPKWMLKLGGLFDKTIRESYEMLYQSEYDYLFDSSKFEDAFHFEPTPYNRGIAATAAYYQEKRQDSFRE